MSDTQVLSLPWVDRKPSVDLSDLESRGKKYLLGKAGQKFGHCGEFWQLWESFWLPGPSTPPRLASTFSFPDTFRESWTLLVVCPLLAMPYLRSRRPLWFLAFALFVLWLFFFSCVVLNNDYFLCEVADFFNLWWSPHFGGGWKRASIVSMNEMADCYC